jgi:hypothetical protein
VRFTRAGSVAAVLRSKDVFAVAGAQVVGKCLQEPVEFLRDRDRQVRPLRGRAEALGEVRERRGREQERGKIRFGQRRFGERHQAFEPDGLFAVQARSGRATFFKRDGAGVGQEVVSVQTCTLGGCTVADRPAASDS